MRRITQTLTRETKKKPTTNTGDRDAHNARSSTGASPTTDEHGNQPEQDATPRKRRLFSTAKIIDGRAPGERRGDLIAPISERS